MRGNLRQSSLAELMRHLYAERKNGVLRLSEGEVKRRVHFEKGVPIFADAADGRVPGKGQALSLLYSLFSWTSGTFAFEDRELNVDDACAFDLSPSVVILEGSRSVRDGGVLEYLTGGRDSVFACTQTSKLSLFTAKLSSAESTILKFAREHQRFTVRDLPLASEDLIVLRALNALLSVGLLEIVEEAGEAPEPMLRQASPRSEVEALLDTFESKRSRLPTSSPSGIDAPPRPTAIESGEFSEEPATPASGPASENVSEPPPPVVTAPPVEDETSLSDLVISWVPTTERARRMALVAVAFAALVGLCLMWLSKDDESPPSGVAAADSIPNDVQPVALALPSKAPETGSEPEAEREPERSEAELFYSANLAFESGEYERSKTELAMLLERRPDFKAARELLDRTERRLAPTPPRPQSTPAPRRAVETPPVPEPKPTVEPAPEPAAPPAPDPTTLLDEARRALARGDLRLAGEKLDALDASETVDSGARELRERLVERRWERKLPIVLTVRHDHTLGGCDGLLTLTKTGYGYRSDEHEWIWSFGEVSDTVRRDSDRLRIETSAGANFNFDLRDGLSDEDWARHQALGDR